MEGGKGDIDQGFCLDVQHRRGKGVYYAYVVYGMTRLFANVVLKLGGNPDA